MQHGDETPKCGRCYREISMPAVYEDGIFFHLRCKKTGEHLLANARRIYVSLLHSAQSGISPQGQHVDRNQQTRSVSTQGFDFDH